MLTCSYFRKWWTNSFSSFKFKTTSANVRLYLLSPLAAQTQSSFSLKVGKTQKKKKKKAESMYIARNISRISQLTLVPLTHLTLSTQSISVCLCCTALSYIKASFNSGVNDSDV